MWLRETRTRRYRGGPCLFLFYRTSGTGLVVAKQKRQSSQAEKDAARARKAPRTTARKDARRDAQEIRRQTNVVRRHMGTLTPWQVSQAKRSTPEPPPDPSQGDVELAA